MVCEWVRGCVAARRGWTRKRSGVVGGVAKLSSCFGFEVRGREVLKSRHVRSLGVTNREVTAALRCGKRKQTIRVVIFTRLSTSRELPFLSLWGSD